MEDGRENKKNLRILNEPFYIYFLGPNLFFFFFFITKSAVMYFFLLYNLVASFLSVYCQKFQKIKSILTNFFRLKS